ncbi:glutamyl-tRNA(Gln) amidotransferase subunit A [Verticillium dahliae VdLs.17]|uniref:Glutamyl-tRNA(Gln) amidotransferase subunit A n=1 Tax=Verticillium dahliae (strain VdLs.17 / ATCC MYA-4575 / FGSC 10137) TaxID=498257 RepID=G2XIG2_VERDV|nr:glutamyl-tRNA(Gln) amidotransferase subunit A [Verticillium dahliae VdLs.17]EGY19610.1 glutamyl-tRNA(Gln) amidotransferase subunit A [Verticillium dahliae VdLs.17]KAH6671479.1 glutamyl-tRNA amidotransferase subunit A [Verticillium dahliae]KAH6701924.1 glutamyl-tRNA amidotransferase subunit A [Verticillium dahliae]
MPPMADGGSQRGYFRRTESPSNQEYVCTSYASGSSSGSGVTTAAGFAPIGLGSETVSSGRAPASINGIVGYSPSQGEVPCRDVWPLYPTCDVLTPHTKTVEDMLAVLDIVMTDEPTSDGDFWRTQETSQIYKSSEIRPKSFSSLMDPAALKEKRLAVPKCYIGKGTTTARDDPAFADSIRALWLQAKKDLETLGASVVETDSPLVENYTKQHFPGQAAHVPGMPEGWMISSDVRPFYAPLDDPCKHTEAGNRVRYADMIDYIRHSPESIHDLPDRFPNNGDVPRADAEEVVSSMQHALRDGVKYSNGTRALKHMSVPAIKVPTGIMADKQMPVGLAFAGRAYTHGDLLRYAYAFETATRHRTSPPLTPSLSSDSLASSFRLENPPSHAQAANLTVNVASVNAEAIGVIEVRHIHLEGTCSSSELTLKVESIKVFSNGEPSAVVRMIGNRPVDMAGPPQEAPTP